MSKPQKYQRKLRKVRGLAVVEFTLVSTAFLFLVFAIIEGSRFIYVNGAIAHTAKEGARYAAVRGASAATDPLRSGDAPATSDSIANYVNSRSPIGDLVTSTSWSPDNSPGSQVTITVTYSFSSFLTLFNDIEISNTATFTVLF